MSETATATAAGAGSATGAATVADRYADLTEIRARTPHLVGERAAARVRRPLLGQDGRLMIVAADHPARGALGVRDRPMAMASRIDLLDRLQTALARPGVDGLLATADIVEDLLLLGALEGKVVIGSMNRGGLQGAEFELDDRFTGYDARGCAQMGLDGGKMLTRVALGDPGTVRTLQATAQAIDELADRSLMAMVEPFWSTRAEGRVHNDLSADAVIRSVGICSGLGRSSAYTWMKLPVVAEMERVMESTTLPTLLLGGDPATGPDETYESWRAALALPAVRGLVVGRTLLYPADDDVAAAVDTAVGLVR